MYDGTFLTYLVPGMELPAFIVALILLVLGIGALVYGLMLAHRARHSKAAVTKHRETADAFYWSLHGMYGTVIGGLLVAANFSPYSQASFLVGLVSMLTFFILFGLMTWRYAVANRNAANANAFDYKVWRFFNG